MNSDFPWIVSVAELDELMAHPPALPAPGEGWDPEAGVPAHPPEDPTIPEAERLDEELTEEEEPMPASPPLRVADVRWYLDGRSGEEAYEAGHVPGAVFVDLGRMLAAPASPAEGRHPLPLEEKFAAAMEVSGIGNDTVVVAYDDAGGASASRLVWLLRATGHRAAVLDGGIQTWTATHGQEALETGPDEVEPTDSGAFTASDYDPAMIADLEETAAAAAGDGLVLDARAPERYRGEVEPMDPRAGHIPGALNLFHAGNLGEDGRFLSPEALRERFAVASGTSAASDSASADAAGASTPIVYCGSGVTATHQIVALAHAGIPARLFPGSWSQYAATDRPVATGSVGRGHTED